MKLFKKPKWLRPEIDEPKYWVHIAVLVGVIYGLMQLYDPNQLTGIFTFIVYGLFLAIADIVAHTILGFD